MLCVLEMPTAIHFPESNLLLGLSTVMVNIMFEMLVIQLILAQSFVQVRTPGHHSPLLSFGPGSGVVSPSGSGVSSPSGSGVVSPSGSGVVSPSGSGVVSPSGSGVVSPSGSGVVLTTVSKAFNH